MGMEYDPTIEDSLIKSNCVYLLREELLCINSRYCTRRIEFGPSTVNIFQVKIEPSSWRETFLKLNSYPRLVALVCLSVPIPRLRPSRQRCMPPKPPLSTYQYIS
jgi:hypothetical protein